MDKLKKMILITLVIIIILIIAIIICRKILIAKELEKMEEEDVNSQSNLGYEILGLKPELIREETTYFYVKDCLDKVLTYATLNNNEKLYDTLNKEYKEKNNITKDNVLELTKLNNISNYEIKEMYALEGASYGSYYLSVNYNDKYEYININWDLKSLSFDLSILTKEEFDKYISTTIEEAEADEKTIERNDNNILSNRRLSDSDIAEKYLIDYVDKAINSPEEAYELLDEQYRNAKFKTFDDFKSYVQNNPALQKFYKKTHYAVDDYDNQYEYLEAQSSIKVSKYDVDKEDDYRQYVCIDSFDNNYIFKATSAMKYTAILDTYTIDIPEFTEKYAKANTQEKVVLNLNKFMLSLNNKDYKYAYNVLANSFKQANFSSLEEFENYAKETFFDQNTFEYVSYDSNGDTYYTYTVTISDSTGQEVDTVTKTFIIQLNEGTDFVLSFNK